MRKKVNFQELSNVVCSFPACKKRLKKNLIARKPRANLCNKHYWWKRITKPLKGMNPTDKTRWNLEAAGIGKRRD